MVVISNCCNVPPIIHCPSNVLACSGTSIDPGTTGRPTVSKGSPSCKEPILNYTDKLNYFSNCNYSIERTWTATDPDHSNLSAHCTQLIQIKDTIPPKITFCPPNITVQSDADCTAKVSWSNPIATDNCGIASITSSVPSGYQFTLGLAAVSIIATDNCGNTSKCEFLVTVEENCCNKNPIIHCPADFQGCPNSSTKPVVTGQASASPGSSKCRQPLITYNDDTIHHTACFTEIHRTWLATDLDKPSLMDYCVQKIILIDNHPPVITFCPPNITVQSDDDCLATVRWNEPAATDDCGSVSITTSVPSGYRFTLGLAAVSVIATDLCGNTSKCEF
ncbi:MAG: HYR domain-containing protein [Saprospiraceae bacterium]|nr:HYR domain-containing protein [Saprospiraceae bacterium]